MTHAAMQVRTRPGSLAWLGAFIGWFAGSVLRIRRAHVESSMRRAGIEAPHAAAREMYRQLGCSLVELLASGLSPRGIARRVALNESELAAVSRHGAVIATAHTANWDVVACSIGQRAALTVITKHLSVGVLDRLWQFIRRRFGVSLVAEGRAARAALGALSRGELVAALVDQAPERTRATVRAPFLGAMADVDLTPALLALRGRTPLVAAFPVRRADGMLSFEVAGILEPPRIPSRRWAERAMIQITKWLDEFVRQHPEQWLWMHRRWKSLPDPTRAPHVETLPGPSRRAHKPNPSPS